MEVWKIGSRWSKTDSEKSSILDIFRKYNIVFAGDVKETGQYTDKIKSSVKIGDLIAVADGIKVKSLGKVKSLPKPLNEFKPEGFETDP